MGRPAILLAALVATVALLPAGSAQAADGTCDAKNARTVVANDLARVYSVRGKVGARRFYACRVNGTRRFSLGQSGDCEAKGDPGDFTLGGRFLAYTSTSCSLDSEDTAVIVLDLKRGTRHVGVPPTGLEDPTFNSSTYIRDLYVTRGGAAVFIGEFDADTNGPSEVREVRKLVPGGPEGGVTVDSGLDIAAGSLSLALDGTFYWLKGSTPKSASLK